VLVITGIVACLLIVLTAGVMISNYVTTTPPFTDASGKVIEGSVATMEKIDLGGCRQTVLIRGKDINNPVLLYIHGGPGSSELPLVRHFNAVLEEHYTVVLWDQRGAGKSWSPFMDDTSMTIARFMEDTYELINVLRNRFHKDKIYLAGHSWGSVLGLATAYKHPELLYAYIGIGQAIDFIEGEQLSLQYAIDKAKEQKNTEALAELEELKSKGYPTITKDWLSDVFTERKWLGEFGGVMYGKKSMADLFTIERPPEFSLFDLVPFALGSYYSLKHLWPQIVTSGDFRKTAPELKVPVYFVTGRHDYNVPFALTEAYYTIVTAPKKEMVWFEKSGHMPNFEEPEKFNEFMVHRLLKETYHR